MLLFLAVVPSTWLIDDEQLRRAVTRVVTQRYGVIAGIALLTSLVTGLYQFYNVTPEVVSEDISSYRFGWIFIAKMTLFTIFIGLIAVHAVVGRRIGRLADAVAAGNAEAYLLENPRRISLMLTLVMMSVAIALLAFGVLLGRGEFSYIPT